VNRADLRSAVAAAGATLLGSLSLSPVFVASDWVAPVFATVVVVLAGGLALRGGVPLLWARMTGSRPVPAVLAGAAVPLVPLGQMLLVGWLLTLMYAAGDNRLGLLPTWKALRTVAGVLSDGGAELREQSTPALPLHGLLALSVVLVGLVAVAVDLLAVAGRQAALAGLGLLVLFCVPISTITGGVGLLAIAAPAAGLALLLWADQSRRLSRRDPDRGRTSPARGGLAAVRIGLMALVAGLVLGTGVPTFTEGSFGSGSGSGSGSGAGGSTGRSLDPVASLKGQLTLPSPIDLLKVKSSVSDPGYLRAVALESFDPRRGWSLGNLDDTQTVVADADLAPLPARESARTVTATIQAVGHDDRYLPVLYSPRSVQVRGAGRDAWRFDPTTSTVFGRGATTDGRTYTVTASQPRPSVGLLESSAALPGANPVQLRDTRLPPLDPSVTQLVQSLTAGARTPYDKVRSIYDYFTDPANGFVYSLSTTPGTSRDDLANFLQTKRGYCEQYAGSMAVLVRASGVPARVALGYTQGSRQQDGSRMITSSDAHAWVEVYFADLGWVPFDPTPISTDRAVQLPWAPRATPQETTGTGPAAATAAAPTQATRPSQLAKDTPVVPVALPDQSSTWVRTAGITTAVVVGVLLLASAPALLRLRQRRRRLADGTPAALWDELAATARDLGVQWHSSRTPRQTALQLAELISGSGTGRRSGDTEAGVAAVRKLALAEEAASYARPGSATGSVELAGALGTARRSLLRSVSGRTRLRALAWPASLAGGLRNLLDRAPTVPRRLRATP
jgi:transglutaminase-like putative cysteine protease